MNEPAPLTRRGLLGLGAGLLVAADDARADEYPGLILPVELRCESLRDPEGIDAERPGLSWRCAPAGRETAGLRQSAYRIRAASTASLLEGGGGDLWDSGRVDSSRTQHVRFGGSSLRTRQIVFWTVQLWDQDGVAGPPGASARWSMGLLDRSDWQAQWIGLDAPPLPEILDAEWFWVDEGRPLERTPPGRRFFRREFRLAQDADAGDLVAFVSAGDVASVTIDGAKIGEAYGWADATEMRLPALAKGRHVIAAMVTNTGDVPKPAGLAVRLDPLFSQARGWVGRDQADGGWRTPEFDDAHWSPVVSWGPTGMLPWGRLALHRSRAVPARWLRRSFTLPTAPRVGLVSFCGLGWSELYVNGFRVGDAMLSPPLTDYDRRATYVTHDVTSLLRAGENVLGVVLGPGRFVAPRPSARNFGWPKLLLRLDIALLQGRSVAVVSDAAWSITLDGSIRDSNEYDGEVVDGRFIMPGWAEPGFDAALWSTVDLVAAPAGALRAMRQNPTRAIEVRAAVAITPGDGTSWTFDFGQNIAGVCRLTTSGPRGSRIALRHAERLRPNGGLDTANLRSALARDVFTLRGEPEESFTPRFTSHGFRYVNATGLAHPPTLETLAALTVCDDLRRTSQFDCSDPLLTRIHDAAMWSARNNCRSIRTDCPQRDERQGWLGDPAEEALGEAYLFDNAAFYAKWLDDIIDTQRPDGALADVAPAYWPLYNDDIAWPAVLASIPGMLHDHFGDLAPVERAYPALARWLERMWEKGVDEYGDWGFLGMAAAAPEPFIAAAYLCRCAARVADYAARLGRTAEAIDHASRAAEAVARLRQKFLRGDGNGYGDGAATSCILALAFDLATPSQAPSLQDRLLAFIMARGEAHPCFGLIGAQWISRVLQRAGRGDLVHRMAVARTRPGLGYMIEHDATTLWELWDGDTADPSMSSLDHTMLTGDLVTWLYQSLAGIRHDPAAPGFARVVIAPQPIETLSWVAASYDAPTGAIESSWRRGPLGTVFEIAVPPNVEATVVLPEARPIVVGSGRHRFDRRP